MYFPGDPLFDLDPIYQATTDQKARDALVASYDHDLTVPDQSMGYRWDVDNELVSRGHSEALRLHGHVYDGAGTPIPDARVEIWQPDCDGAVPREAGSLHRDGWTFTGWGRCATDRTGHYSSGTTSRGRGPDMRGCTYSRLRSY
jgi:protocatechuate 3,4-dioxygenase beta subunit